MFCLIEAKSSFKMYLKFVSQLARGVLHSNLVQSSSPLSSGQYVKVHITIGAVQQHKLALVYKVLSRVSNNPTSTLELVQYNLDSIVLATLLAFTAIY